MEIENEKIKKKNTKYRTKDSTLISLRMKNVDIEKFNEIAKFSKVAKSELIRGLLKENPVTLVEYTNDELIEKYDRILKIFDNVGNNINQISTNLNKGGIFKNEDMEVIKKASSNLEVLIKILRNKTIITRKEI